MAALAIVLAIFFVYLCSLVYFGLRNEKREEDEQTTFTITRNGERDYVDENFYIR